MLKKLVVLQAFFFCMTIVVCAQTYQRLTNLPHIYIETFNGVRITSKTVYIYATMHYVDETDSLVTYDSLQIRGRGNSTWQLSKKPYKIKFQQKEKFLGKGYAKAKKWTLLANAGDKTMMRNAISSLLGDFLGIKNNPAHKFVDVTLNDVYIGTYQISDQVEVRPHRVNVVEQDYPLTEESDITGGYLLEVDGFKDGNCFTTSRYQVPIRVHYPEDEEIASSQNSYIRQYMRDFETVLANEDFADADRGYRKWVDSTSLANWFIATEVSGNVDGYFSTYFYKEQQDSCLYWGPLWDYDIAYNNDNRTDRGGSSNTERQLMTDHGYGATKNWLNRMWEDPWFGALVTRRYGEVVEAGLEDYLYTQIDSVAELLNESQVLNYNRWGISTRAYRERVLYSSYDQYVNDLKAYIHTHMAYLQTAFEDKKEDFPEAPTPPFVPGNYYYTIANVNNGRLIDMEDKVNQPGDLVCSWQATDGQLSQQWKIIPIDSYFMLINRNSDMALNDPTEGESTATTNVGTQLNTAEPNTEDERQLWSIVPQGTSSYYNLVNKYTEHTVNLRGGSSVNGTPILSYTTDERNATSTNRLWYIVAGEEIVEEPNTPEELDTPEEPGTPEEPDVPENPDTPEEPNSVLSPEPAEYALAYNPQSRVIHFGSETPEALTFTASIYTPNATLVRSFRASESCSVADLSRGVYIIVWHVGGVTRSTKLLIP